MILSFFQNACILIASMSAVQHFIRNKKVYPDMLLKSKILWGVYNAILGIILMINSVPITADTFIDFRYIAILLSSIYGGILSSIISSIFIGIFRFLYLGISNISLIGLIDALLMGIGFGIIALLKLSKKSKYIYSMLLFIMISVIVPFILARNQPLIVKAVIVYYSGYLIVSYLSIKYAEYILETVKIYQRLKNEATKDYLTGLNNVRQFDNSFNDISQMIIRKEKELSMLFIDVDFFKKINDTYGHDAGDAILKGLAPIFLNTCRTYDVVSRMGGEEFSIILLDCSESKAVKIAERLRKNVENNDFYISDDKTIKITISIGISSYPRLTSQIDDLLENADIALYEAKNTGRNKVVLFNNEKHNV
ncbi:GGDEF domain-containing protein [Clostridium saccharobutylicum]|uniref:Diguanylate cyclase n=1 Tax=Clostridium saccharobutylicum DSM 13864 TaxID=1345695 RepID=U5MR01_CLOSA|nr:GGDEF domain-containing protein [Clostridium saccharobutylicum]AGX43020.1 diguanylate cyclase [Clostridium saccharobutylicum DSM 13864]AQR90311.1 response regulator PleD [Clostridium saccharobutylicum]AQS00217.1 response regulator PleD [Clostridium saccharobutylicum]AQS10016.1 response regulator PleD [Clostridium saccharobutylicum]AQS14200.1 response regulator PleD [Clostridium saccharobutylicum]